VQDITSRSTPTQITNAGGTHSRPTPPAHRPSVQDGLDTVRSYMKREIGMRDPRLSRFRWTGKDAATVEVRAWIASERTLGPETVVSIRRLRTVWFVTGALTNDIQVDEAPLMGQVPAGVRISGQMFDAVPWHVTVTQDRYGQDVVLGGDVLADGQSGRRDFQRNLRFSRPTAGTGSVIFSQDLGMGGGALRATVIRVRFAPTPAAPSCTPSSLLPVLRSWFDDPSNEARIAKVQVLRCRNGYAFVIAVPRVNPPGHNQLDGLQVLMQYRNGRWHSLDFGTSIGCDEGGPFDKAVQQACAALGYTH
jgi:hypothetical protein